MPVEPEQRQSLPPDDCLCVVVWSASFEFFALASESTELDCTTLPPFPGLSTRIGALSFFAWSCVAIDAASAACSFLAS